MEFGVRLSLEARPERKLPEPSVVAVERLDVGHFADRESEEVHAGRYTHALHPVVGGSALKPGDTGVAPGTAERCGSK